MAKTSSEFKKKTLKALVFVIESAEYSALLKRFKRAYEYRRQYDCLGESGKLPGSETGLFYALKRALALYSLDTRGKPVAKRNSATGVDEQFKAELRVTAKAVCHHKLTMGTFGRALLRAGMAIHEIGDRDLSRQIAKALDIYSCRATSSTSADPW